MAINLEVILDDGVSPGAKAAKASVDALTASLFAMQRAAIKSSKGQEMFDLRSKLATAKKSLADQVKADRDAKKLIADNDKKARIEAKRALDDKAKLQDQYNASLSAGVGVASAAAAAYLGVASAILAISFKAYDAAANANLLATRLTALSGGKTAGKDVLAMISKLAEVLPNTTAEMAAWNEQMIRGGVRDIPRLTQATKAAAAAFVLTGDEGSRAVTDLVTAIDSAAKHPGTGISNITDRIRAMGLTVEEVADNFGLQGKSLIVQERLLNAYGASGGKNLVKLGNSIQDTLIKRGIPAMTAAGQTWDVFTKKLKDNANQLFTGVTATKGFQDFALGLQRVVRLLSGASSSSGSTKDAMTSAFDAIFSVGARALEGLQIAILKTQITILKTIIFLAPVIRAFIQAKDALDEWGLSSKILDGLAVAFKVLAVSAAIFLAPIVLAGVAIAAVGTGIVLLLGFIGKIVKAIPDAAVAIKDAALLLGDTIVDGVTGGIKRGYEKVKGAVVGLAKGAIDFFKGSEGIDAHSPSRKFERLGHYTSEGFARGVEGGAATAIRATEAMIEGGTPVKASTGDRAGGGVTLHIHEGAIVVQGGGDAKETAEMTVEMLMSNVERLLLTQGGGSA